MQNKDSRQGREGSAMVFAVCDDNDKARENLAAYLRQALRERMLEGKVLSFSSGEEMLAAMKGRAFPVNFLDIYMEGISGVQLAQEILQRDPKAAIVFTTSSKDHMAEGFSVGAVHYLVKPYTAWEAGVALDRCLRLVGRAEPYIELSVEREARRVLLSRLRYVEFQNRCCYLHAGSEVLRVYMRLDELQAKLADPRFLRCHRSFIVNLDFVSGLSGYDFVMSDEGRVPVRRENRAAMKTAFEDYYFERARRGL